MSHDKIVINLNELFVDSPAYWFPAFEGTRKKSIILSHEYFTIKETNGKETLGFGIVWWFI